MVATKKRHAVIRQLPCPITETEVDTKSAELARATIDERAYEIAIDKINEDHKAEKKRLEQNLAEMAGVRIKLAQELTTGEVERDIECEWRFNVFDGTAILVRTDTGEAVELRDITAEERQMQLGEAVKAPTPEQLSQWKKQLAKRGVTIEPQERPLL